MENALSIIEAISGVPCLIVFVIAILACRARLSSPRPREGRLVGIAIALLVVQNLHLLGGVVIGLGALISLIWVQQRQFVFSLAVLVSESVDSCVYVAAWGFIFYSAFGPGSVARTRFLIENRKTDISSPLAPVVDTAKQI